LPAPARSERFVKVAFAIGSEICRQESPDPAGQRSRIVPSLSLLVRAATLALLAAPIANAEEARPCAERSSVVRKLEERFGETLRSLGLHRDDGLVEIYSSEKTGTWTILLTHPDGMSCLLAAGQSWEQDVPRPTRTGGDA
jgi:hypothetical protein